MIICVSANPALDRRIRLRSLRPGEIHRARESKVAAGGKAAHVAMVARTLGESVLWIALTGGAAGEQCRHGLEALGIEAVTVETRGVTRTNLEFIEEESGRDTEIREPGDAVSAQEVADFMECCREHLRKAAGSCVVLSGSLPPGIPADFYGRLIEEIHAFGSTALLDASGEALSSAMPSHPDVIKPNKSEASEAVNRAVDDLPGAISAAQTLLGRGARAVALSLGARGMLWADGVSTSVLYGRGPEANRASTAGCGDSMLAGIAVALNRRLPFEDVVRLAIACGTANCYARMPGMAEKKTVDEVMASVVVRDGLEALRMRE